MKPQKPPTKPDMDFPELQANWSYCGVTQPSTVYSYELNGTKLTVTHNAPERGVKPEKEYDIQNIRPW